MIEKENLRSWAIKLENEIIKNKPNSSGVMELSETQYVMDAIDDAKKLKINKPTEQLGNLIYFFQHTDLLNFIELCNALACFITLLEGRKLIEKQA
jgi:hypothetical protein